MNEALINVNGNNVQSLEMLFTVTILALLPSIVIMMTSFTRIIISLSFLRTAMGLQNTPPNMVVTGIALFLTFFIMSPTITRINEEAYTPYRNEEITQSEALQRASVPMKEFMLSHTEVGTLNMYLEFAGLPADTAIEELPMRVVTPAFMTSELKRGFLIGFLLYIPFLLIDVVVASTLMSMGMIMLPPATISMPFKILLFITVNGWELLFSTLIQGF